MHIALELSNGCFIMDTDILESMRHKLIEGNNFSLSINADS
jgi:PhnB protein